MGTSQPIRSQEDLQALINYFRVKSPSPRNYTLVCMGIYTALRVGDMLELKWSDVYDYERREAKNYLELTENKTEKEKRMVLHPRLKDALQSYFKHIAKCSPEKKEPVPGNYVFSTMKNPERPITRTQAWRIVTKAAERCMREPEHISCHSLRKTFGYHAWRQGAQPALLMEIYNHSSYRITKKYLGIRQDEYDELYLGIRY